MRVFLSYAEKDRKFARELIASLAEEGVRVWDSRPDVVPGENWAMAVGKALESANAMVLLISPAALKSENFQREMEYALFSERFKNRLIPVLVKDAAQIPWILQRFGLEKGDPRHVSRRIAARLRDRRRIPAHQASSLAG